LVAAFERRRRKPRLEYIAAVAPVVEPALVAHGFAVEERYPVMLCALGAERNVPTAPGFEIGIAQSDADLLAAATAQAAAYGNEAPRLEPLQRMVEQGGVLVFARHAASSAMAAAGMATPHSEAISEVAGIGVRADFRRRGLAGALTARIVREAFESGATLAWLTLGHSEAQRIYARAGFAVVSEQLHISQQ
jgi:ribosomal protein S18 acetylase RimI-like enzyme